MKVTILFVLLFCKTFISFAQEIFTDSTIISDVKPTSELNLWYGHAQLKLTELVILKNYTLIFDAEKDALFLLDNVSHLIQDTLFLQTNPNISPVSYKDFYTYEPKKSAIDPLSWKSFIENDSTIWVLPVMYKKTGAGSIKLSIKNKKIYPDYISFNLKNTTLLSKYSYDTRVYPYSFVHFHNYKIYSFYSNLLYIPNKKNIIRPHEDLVIKQTMDSSTSVIYTSDIGNHKTSQLLNLFVFKESLFAFYLFKQRLIIFDKEWNKIEIELKDYFNVPNFRYAAFLVDITSQKLYISISTRPPLATSNLQSIYEVTFPSPQEIKLDFVKTFDLRQMKVKSIDNNHIYLWNPKNGFIYTYKIR